MAQIMLQRTSLRTSFSTVAELVKVELDSEHVNITEVKRLWKRLEDRFISLNKIDEEIMNELLEKRVTQEEMNNEIDAVQEYRDVWNDLNSFIDEMMAKDKKYEEESLVQNMEGKSRYKLPKLKLMEFDGCPKQWLNFWSQFKGIDEDKHLSPEEKFQYLIQSTTKDSAARRIVVSFPPTAANYKKAIEHLKSRFGKDNVLVEVYVRDLLKLVLSNANGNQKLPLSQLYDQLATQLRALESLGVTTDKYAAMLYPLVESSLSEDVLRTWERLRNQQVGIEDGTEDQLQKMMNFLRNEVESDVRLKMAKRSLVCDEDDAILSPPNKAPKIVFEPITTADLFNKESFNNCAFCTGRHTSQDCNTAKRFSMETKRDKLKSSGKCFKCFKGNHMARACKAVISCKICKKAHYDILCRQSQNGKIKNASAYFGGFIILQTLVLKIETNSKTLLVRVLIDSGSQRSYISRNLVDLLGYQPSGHVDVNHCLFGGLITKETKHGVYTIEVKNMQDTSTMQLELLDVEKICGYISSVPDGPWVTELNDQGITISDNGENYGDINILLGADIASYLYTGKIIPTRDGPVAFETTLGWTLMGKIDKAPPQTNYTLFTHTLHVSNLKLEDLWKLDIIGITDPIVNKTRDEMIKSTLKDFEKGVCKLNDGRYEVQLPWMEGYTTVGDNKDIAIKRLQSTWKKLEETNMVNAYEEIFEEWLRMGIIEEVSEDNDTGTGISYLPHHPVFNPKSTTTPIRPVFDASAKSKGHPSLNDCLQKGPNLIELILDILMKFRMGRFAALSDIKKAFLQISIAIQDRNFLRFLLYRSNKLRIYRHCRVVFGLKCSPFLLAATLCYHLDNLEKQFKQTADLLKSSMYVDNLVVSVDTEEEMKRFILEAMNVCGEAKFELRNWVWNMKESMVGAGQNKITKEMSKVVSVLGLLWDIEEDTLTLDLRKFLVHTTDKITKRNVLAATHRIYDPMGIVSPVTIVPKMMLQELFKQKMKWDEPVTKEVERRFKRWLKDVELLQLIKIPRWVMNAVDNDKKSIHIFTDASKKAYAAIAFLRIENNGTVDVRFLMAKSRVTTVKAITIPKLELIGCECGAKLFDYLTKTLKLGGIGATFWSDSSNALSWIKRNECWQLFVQNRVSKIQELTPSENWRHIPGDINPADLPSRGCTATQIINSQWWEGPAWLRKSEEFWPKSEINCDEEIVMAERKRTIVSHSTQILESSRYFHRFSNLRKIVRVIAWMRRWRNYKRDKPRKIDLSMEEESEAEVCLWKLVQSETIEHQKNLLSQFKAFKDTKGLWRVKTRLLMRPDSVDFRCPVLLPKDHIAVRRLIQSEHKTNQHMGTPALRCLLRERFWILNSRVVVRQTVNQCGRCRRFEARKFGAPEPPLPLNRIRDATTFEIVGIDLGGPHFLNNGMKVWFAIFTCAVYRAVHLELVTSLSTEAFIQALRRFIARRGRPTVIYTDNGTNFTGTENLMKQLDWDEISKTSIARKFKWIFNPPSAPWWGGWWEKLVGLVKTLLYCNLGKQTLNYVEMETILCDFEQVINSRPLTYVTEDTDELVPLTPMMFLTEARSSDVPDLDEIEGYAFGSRYKHRQEVRQELRERFRKEYLSLLTHRNIRHGRYNSIKIGDIVLVELDNKKRIDWPVGKVIELFPSIDGMIRSVKLEIKGKQLTRAIQRLYLLETTTEDLKTATIGNNNLIKHQENEARMDKAESETSQNNIEQEVTTENQDESSQEDNMHKQNEEGAKNVITIKSKYGRLVKKPYKYSC